MSRIFALLYSVVRFFSPLLPNPLPVRWFGVQYKNKHIESGDLDIDLIHT